MSPEETARWLLRDGEGLVTRRDLRRSGVSRTWITRRIAEGRLRAIHPQVLAAPDLRLDRRTQFRAALLQAGPDAALSHLSALEVWGLLDGKMPSEVHVAVPRTGCRSVEGVRIHYRSPRGSTTYREGLPVMEPVNALAGASSLLDVSALRFPAMEAVRIGLVAPGDLHAVPGLPRNASRAMRLIGQEAREGAESGGEANFWRLVEESDLPTPVLQHEVSTYLGVKRIDAYWPDLRLGAEIDGRDVHTKALAFEKDLRRQNAIHATGIVLIRFSVNQVMTEPWLVLRDIEAAMAARRWDLRPAA